MSADSVRVELGDRGYEILIGSGGLKDLGRHIRGVIDPRATRAFVLVDSGVPEAQVGLLMGSLDASGFASTREVLNPSEPDKSLETFGRVMDRIASTGHGRVDPVVSIGGGIVCDIAGFVAAAYRRGVPVVQCPSTMLAMADASVGGKTGVNLRIASGGLLKNLVGAFHQPSLVCADVDLLDSLPERHFRSGIAECVKQSMICGSVGHLGVDAWMRAHLRDIGSRDPVIVAGLIARNAALKASVVARDEHESPDAPAGGRMLLNLGHTFGHAIETIGGVRAESASGLGDEGLYHGEAVALGMVAACRCSESMGLCAPGIGDSLVEMLGVLGLPLRVEGLPANDVIIARMGHDKKVVGSTIRVILPVGSGECTIIDDAPIGALSAGIDAIRV